MAGLEKAAEAATTQEALLSGAMAAQGNFIATQYTSDLQKAELGLDGLSQKLKTYAQYQARGTTDTQAGQKALGQLVLALEVSGAHLGSTTGQVDALITSMLHIPKSKIIQITVQLALSGNLAAYDLLQQEGLGGTIRAQLPGSNSGPGKHGATGMLVPSGFSHDNFPAYLQSGEAVVPAHLTPYVAPFLKAHGVPGFASGWVPPRMSSYTGIGGGGDTHFHINVNGDSDQHGAAKVIIQKVRAYKAVTGNQATGIG